MKVFHIGIIVVFAMFLRNAFGLKILSTSLSSTNIHRVSQLATNQYHQKGIHRLMVTRKTNLNMGPEFQAIKDINIIRSTDGRSVSVESLWQTNERAILVCFRSFGWFFCQELAKTIAREVIPRIKNSSNIKLLCVGIGTYERSQEFCSHVGFPSNYLFADPNNGVYDALGINILSKIMPFVIFNIT